MLTVIYRNPLPITVMTKYSILLPTYNESENLPIVVWLLEKYLRDVEYEVYGRRIDCAIR